MNESMPCPYCGGIGYHTWAGEGGCPGVGVSNHYSYKIEELQEELRALDAEIERRKSLLTRAADALEWPGQLLGSDFRKLIAELRKAAE